MARILGFIAVCFVVFLGLNHQFKFFGAWHAVEIDAPDFKRVVLYPDSDASDVQIALIYPYGEMANPYEEGLAHYLEHLVAVRMLENFQTPVFRHGNAWTNHFSTTYFGIANRGALEGALQKAFDTAIPLTTDPKFAREERNIVLREYEQGNEHTDAAAIYQGVRADLYEDASYGRSVIGTPAEISSYDLETTKELHTRSHRLSEATLIVHGNLTKQDLTRILERLEPSVATSVPPIPEPKPLPVTLARLEQEGVQAGMATNVIWRKLVRVEECHDTALCDAQVSVLERVLDSAMDGGIAGPLRFDAFFARSFKFDLIIAEPGVVEIAFSAVTDQGVTPPELVSEFERVLAEKLQQPIPEETFERVLSRILDDWDLEETEPEDEFKAAMDWVMAGQPPVSSQTLKEAYQAITKDKIESLAAQLGAPGRVVVRHLN